MPWQSVQVLPDCRLWVQVEHPHPQQHAAAQHKEKWVVLFHGFPDTAQMWNAQVTALTAAGFSVAAPDMPGFGRSAFSNPADVSKYRLRNVAAAMCGLLDQLGISSACVIGHDWGAAVAWTMALQAPARVERLVVLSVGHPGAGAAVDPRQRAHWWYQLFFCLPDADATLMADEWALFKQVLGPNCTHQQLDEYITRLAQPGALTSALNWYKANTHARHFGATQAMPATQLMSMPVLGVWSTKDTALLEPQMLASTRFVTAGCWQYVRLEGIGHWIPRDAPTQLSKVLLEFLSAPTPHASRL